MVTEMLANGAEWPYSKAKTSVLEAMANVIRETGPRSATLKKIAGKVGITEPAIFRHFNGVDGLFHGLFFTIECAADSLHNAYDPSLAPLERLEALLRAEVALVAADPDVGYVACNMREVFMAYSSLRPKMDEIRARNKADVRSCLVEAEAKGLLKPDMSIETMSLCLLGAVHGLCSEWLDADLSFDLEETFSYMWIDLRAFIAAKRRRAAKPKTKAGLKG